MKKVSIITRLEALEARPPKVDTEHHRRRSAAIKAMLDTVSHRGKWARSTVPPFNLVQQTSDIELLWERIEAGTLTDADNDLMASWPKCHLEPVQLVGMLAQLTQPR